MNSDNKMSDSVANSKLSGKNPVYGKTVKRQLLWKSLKLNLSVTKLLDNKVVKSSLNQFDEFLKN